MKKLLFLITVTIGVLFVSCVKDYKETRIESKVPEGYIEQIYVLDTLTNGHIIMRQCKTREYGFIEYPECPKCRENLKKLINEVLDERAIENMSKGY